MLGFTPTLSLNSPGRWWGSSKRHCYTPQPIFAETQELTLSFSIRFLAVTTWDWIGGTSAYLRMHDLFALAAAKQWENQKQDWYAELLCTQVQFNHFYAKTPPHPYNHSLCLLYKRLSTSFLVFAPGWSWKDYSSVLG